MSYLILIRHGQSRWNLSNKFTGWVDVPLSRLGIREAEANARELKNFRIDVAFTSELVRAQETLLIILSSQNRTGIFLHHSEHRGRHDHYYTPMASDEIPIYSSSILNERYYGLLQGLDKAMVRQKYGEKKVMEWRRSFQGRPPGGDSLADIYRKLIPYFKKQILPWLKKNKNVIVVAHGNTLRAMIKYLENISDQDVAHLELPNSQPLVYRFGAGKMRREKGEFTFKRKVFWRAPKRKILRHGRFKF
ncbi:MAG TPA: histidine phosphatase family protein [Candidatus Methylomirabilis sp.]|nr:histidine phosphatase family protein [Candidatus Methylomirabilis sp.]